MCPDVARDVLTEKCTVGLPRRNKSLLNYDTLCVLVLKETYIDLVNCNSTTGRLVQYNISCKLRSSELSTMELSSDTTQRCGYSLEYPRSFNRLRVVAVKASTLLFGSIVKAGAREDHTDVHDTLRCSQSSSAVHG